MSRPIIMSAESVRAILAGRKAQTRRVVRGQEPWPLDDFETLPPLSLCCPFGAPGDRLWVREIHRFWSTAASPADPRTLVQYRVDMAERWCDAEPKPAHTADEGGKHESWRSPIYMPRWAARLTLEATGVRVERLQAITEEDALAEGAADVTAFSAAWNAIHRGHPERMWSSSPWVFVVAFRRLP